MPGVGSTAPAFGLLDQHGDLVSLEQFQGSRVFVYFYPKAGTPGCTMQACALRDVMGRVRPTMVVGVSPDAPAALERFAAKHQLSFVLLSDPDHAVAERYGAWGEKKLYGKITQGVIRSAVLVDEKGQISHEWPKISPKETPTALLAAIDL